MNNKIVSAHEMSEIEKYDYAHGASEDRFMEEAGRGVAQKAEELFQQYNIKSITILCGKGNNGGDAFVAALHLIRKKIPLKVYLTAPQSVCSPLCQKYSKEFSKKGSFETISKAEEIHFPEHCLIIDGLLGTGFKGSLEGLLKDIVLKVNDSKHPVLAVDIPSGVNGTTGEIGSVAIQATFTLFLGFAKTGCFLEPAWNHVGQFTIHPFGLSSEAENRAKPDYLLIEKEKLQLFFPKRERNIHKYTAGYVIALAGSPGMPGAAILSCYAALKSGAGIVRLLHPKGMEAELSSAPYELIRQGYDFNDDMKEIFEKASGILIGPGIGKSQEMMNFLKQVIPSIHKPCVIDAEALFLFSQVDIKPPKDAVFTPHRGEMKRLLKKIPATEIDFLKACQTYAKEQEIVLVLKGSPTFIFYAENTPYISVKGDPGMATAGSGDVLTGMVAAFLAQGLSPHEAAMTAVYLHGLSGEAAAATNTSYSVTASDLIHHLPDAISQLIE